MAISSSELCVSPQNLYMIQNESIIHPIIRPHDAIDAIIAVPKVFAERDLMVRVSVACLASKDFVSACFFFPFRFALGDRKREKRGREGNGGNEG